MGDHCRSCGAPIEWAVTRKGSRIPLDVGSRPDANIVIDELGIAQVVPAGDGVRTSHFATCPDAAKYRRRDRRARA